MARKNQHDFSLGDLSWWPSNMFRILCFSACVLTVDCSPSTISVVFSPPGANVSLPCLCPEGQVCYEALLRWLHLRPNGSMEVIDTGKENQKSRFISKSDKNDFLLTIHNAELEDSGRYYCAEHAASYLRFYSKGTVLHVGEVWTNRSEVLVLTKWRDEEHGSLTTDRAEDQAELLCVVTGLTAPWVPVTWRSSRDPGLDIIGQTWSTTLSSGEYCVISWLREPSDEAFDEAEERWCEVQIGTSEVRRSSMSSFRRKSEEQGWHHTALYAVIVVCILCLGLLSIFCCFRQHLLRGTQPQAALTEIQGGIATGVTYAHLNFKAPGGTRNHKNKERKRDNHTDRMVYSEVRYKLDG